MRSGIGFLTLVAGFAMALAGAAHAGECQTPKGQGKTLEGEVRQINKKNLIVVSRGDPIPVKFERYEAGAVKGLKQKYEDLKKGDYVEVCSKMLDKPRVAYEITVKEKPKDDAEDVQ